MKNLRLFALSLITLFTLSLPVLAADLYYDEYEGVYLAPGGSAAPIPLGYIQSGKITIGASSAESSVLSPKTEFVDIYAGAGAYYAIGEGTVTATSTGRYVATGERVPSHTPNYGATDRKIAVIQE